MSDITYLPQHPLCAEHHDAILDLLRQCDTEFYPPLSERVSTQQTSFVHDAPRSTHNPHEADGVKLYFDEMAHQHCVLALLDGTPVGILSYIDGMRLPCLDEPSAYVSTVLVHPEHRHKGIASGLYGYLEQIIAPPLISLRTWSTNTGQLALLDKRGYELINRIPNDRDDGVDTVYFALRPESEE